MNNDRELLQMALDALEKHVLEYETAEALRARLAQPEPEPLWIRNEEGKLELHATPQREWQGLTEYEVGFLTVFDGLHDVEVPLLANFIRHIEAKLKEKNA